MSIRRFGSARLTLRHLTTIIRVKVYRMVMDNTTATISVPSTNPRRNFSVYDLMIVIAGLAILLSFSQRPFLILIDQCCGMFMTAAAYFGFISSNAFGSPKDLKQSMANFGSGAIWCGLRVSEQLILVGTPVFLLMRFRNPRPPIRVLLKQPGTIAGLAAALGLTLVAGWLHRFFYSRLVDGMVNPIAVGGTVALAWVCLALSRKWEPESSWIDRFGRIFGVAVIVGGAVAYLMFGLFS